MITPVSTEKATTMSKNGAYTFWVDSSWTKGRIKSEIANQFKVKVVTIKTLNYRGQKKAIVTLSDGQKIEAFEEKKKK